MAVIVLLVTAIFAVQPLITMQNCPDGYQDYEGQCYLMSDEKKTFDEAKLDCESQGAELAELHDLDTKTSLDSAKCRYWVSRQTDEELIDDFMEASNVFKYVCQAPAGDGPTPDGDGDGPTPGDGEGPTPGDGDGPPPGEDGDGPTPDGDGEGPTPGDDPDARCTDLGGTCQLETEDCPVKYEDLCAAPKKCCLRRDAKCRNTCGGVCQLPDLACPIPYYGEKCECGGNRQCCVPADFQCIEICKGTCQIDNEENTCALPLVYQSNKCGGIPSRKCCAPEREAGTTEETPTGPTEEPPTEDPTVNSDVACESQDGCGGVCQRNNMYCPVPYYGGKCAQAESGNPRSCCAPADKACLDINGKCQDPDDPCDGEKRDNLCGGSRRICCVPVDGDGPTPDGDEDGPTPDGDEDGPTPDEDGDGPTPDGDEDSPTPDGDDVTPGQVPEEDKPCVIGCKGVCQNKNLPCDGVYSSGLCGGDANRQCCAPVGDITKVETTGAKAATAGQDDLDITGVEASHTMADKDKSNVDKYKDNIVKVAGEKNIDPAIIAAIISRESRGGTQLNNGWGDEGNGWGLMQVDKRHHTPLGGATSVEHMRQATDILIKMITAIKKKFPKWTPEQQLKGGIAAYNFGVKNVWTYENMDQGTTGHDYANDVVARAQWYKENGY